MVFDELSNDFFPFSSTMRGSRVSRGGGVETPPPRRCEGDAEHRRGAG